MLEHTLAALPADLLDVRVVTRSAEVADLATRCGFAAVLHDAPLQSDTIRAGLSELGETAACLFVPGDQPLFSQASVRALVLASARRPDAVARLSWQGAPGSPVMWPHGCYATLAALEGDVGGSELLKSGSSSVPQVILVEATRAAELEDIDTPEDLIELERLA